MVHPDDFRIVESNQSFWLPVNAGLKEAEYTTQLGLEDFVTIEQKHLEKV